MITLDGHDAASIGDAIRGTHWTARLLQLIAKSDAEHLEALRRCFPDHVRAWEEWVRGDRP